MSGSMSTIRQNPEMQQIFNKLPLAVQESIAQSGVQLKTPTDLQQCAQAFLNARG